MPDLILPQRQLTVTYGNRTRIVLIPRTGDIVWDKELEEWAREKTLADLKKLPPLLTKTKEQKQAVAGALKEFNEWRRKKQAK